MTNKTEWHQHWTCPNLDCEQTISGTEGDTRRSLARQLGGDLTTEDDARLICSCGSVMGVEHEEVYLPQGSLEDLLNGPEAKEKLISILQEFQHMASYSDADAYSEENIEFAADLMGVMT